MSQVMTAMTQQVAVAVETDSLRDVWNTMRSLNVRHVPVTRHGKVVGILSDRDILKRARLGHDGELRVPELAASEAMSHPVRTCQTSDRIGYAATVMLEYKIDALPVINAGGQLIGILTSTDLLHLLRDKEEEIQSLPWTWRTEPVQRCWRPTDA